MVTGARALRCYKCDVNQMGIEDCSFVRDSQSLECGNDEDICLVTATRNGGTCKPVLGAVIEGKIMFGKLRSILDKSKLRKVLRPGVYTDGVAFRQ